MVYGHFNFEKGKKKVDIVCITEIRLLKLQLKTFQRTPPLCKSFFTCKWLVEHWCTMDGHKGPPTPSLMTIQGKKQGKMSTKGYAKVSAVDKNLWICDDSK